MPVLSSLKGISKPAYVSDIEFVNEPINYVKAGIELWYDICRNIISKDLIIIRDFLPRAEIIYGEALRLICNRMDGIRQEELFSCFNNRSAKEKNFAGIFISALINKSCLDEVVFKDSGITSFQGYKLERGRISNQESAHTTDIGTCATGGLAENYKPSGLIGFKASGNVIMVNYYFSGDIAENSEGGIYINTRYCQNFSRHADDGFFLNLGVISKYDKGKEVPGEFGTKAKGGIHIMGINSRVNFLKESSSGAVGISYEQLVKDTILDGYINQIRYFLVKKLVKEKQDEIGELASKVKLHIKVMSST